MFQHCAVRNSTLLYFVSPGAANLMHCLHVLSQRHVLSPRGDSACRKVHSLHVLSPLRSQHYNLSSSLGVCVCVCVCVRARARACGWVGVALCCVLLSPRQSVLNWNFVLL